MPNPLLPLPLVRNMIKKISILSRTALKEKKEENLLVYIDTSPIFSYR